MAVLRSCPRCTQALPASAVFCRRCGAAVGSLVTAPVVPAATDSGSFLTAALSALVAVGAIAVGFLYVGSAHVASPPPAPVFISPSVQTVTAPPQVQAERSEGEPQFTFSEPARRDGGDRYRRGNESSEGRRR